MDTIVLNNSESFLCLSVYQLAYILTEIRQIQGYLLLQMRYFSDIFLRHSLDVSTLFPNNQKLLVCLSSHQLADILTEIRPIQGYLLSWKIYSSEYFWRHSWDVFKVFPNNYKFLVCLSGSNLAYLPTDIRLRK